MFANLKTAMAGAAGILCLVVGLAFGLLAGGVSVRAYDSFVTIPDAERAAKERADALWKDAVADAKAKAEDDRKVAEEEIAKAERKYLAKDADRVLKMTGLEQALEREKANAPPSRLPGEAASCVARPMIPKEVTRALNQLGRSSRVVQPPP